jgi:hypothetical protein
VDRRKRRGSDCFQKAFGKDKPPFIFYFATKMDFIVPLFSSSYVL